MAWLLEAIIVIKLEDIAAIEHHIVHYNGFASMDFDINVDQRNVGSKLVIMMYWENPKENRSTKFRQEKWDS